MEELKNGPAEKVVVEPIKLALESGALPSEDGGAGGAMSVSSTDPVPSSPSSSSSSPLALAPDTDYERIQAKSRADRAWKEFRSILYTRSELENSIFDGPGHAELSRALGNFRLFRTVRQTAPVFSTLLKANLLLCAIVVFFFTFQIDSPQKSLSGTYLEVVAAGMLSQVIAATVILAFLAGLLWLSQRPKRLKILPNMLVLRTDLNAAFFSELIIPWPTVESVELTHRKLIGSSELETRVEISTALGIKHFIPLDDLLIDNSEASFINAVRTWAPWAARELTFTRAGEPLPADKGGRLTELWLHQFNSTSARRSSGALEPGSVLEATTSSAGPAARYTVLGVLGGGGQGNTYLASTLASTLSSVANSALRSNSNSNSDSDSESASSSDSPPASISLSPDDSPSAATLAAHVELPSTSQSVSNLDSASHSASDSTSHSASDSTSHSASDSTSHSASDSTSHSASDSTSHSASHSASHVASSAAGPSLEEQAGERLEVVLKEYIMPVYRGSSVLARISDKLGDEATLLARLDHPRVVKVWHHFVNDYRGYLVLEYVEGRSLKELVATEGTQPEAFVVDVGLKLLDVLAYLHGFNPPIVHRDLTPDNVMLSLLGEIKVVDFNVARQLEGSAGSTVVGKHAYIPPEQFRGKPAPASDIYALGGTLHFLLTGQDPEPLSVSHPRQIKPNISIALDQIVARATATDLADRYGSAREMIADLSRILT